VVGYKGVQTYVSSDPVTLLKLGPSSPLKRWIVLGVVPRLGSSFPSISTFIRFLHFRSVSLLFSGGVSGVLQKPPSAASSERARVTANGRVITMTERTRSRDPNSQNPGLQV
jgi:hypothetical protein